MIAGLKTEVVARGSLALEQVAPRQQLAVLERSGKRPKLRQRDRVFWVLLSAFWLDWRSALMIVKPDTDLGWRRRGFSTLLVLEIEISQTGPATDQRGDSQTDPTNVLREPYLGRTTD